MTTRRIRRASRILLLNGAGELLLFRFTPTTAPPSGARRGARPRRAKPMTKPPRVNYGKKPAFAPIAAPKSPA
jgi:hypothetical protein